MFCLSVGLLSDGTRFQQNRTSLLCCWTKKEHTTLTLPWKSHHRQRQPRWHLTPARQWTDNWRIKDSNAQRGAVQNNKYRYVDARLMMLMNTPTWKLFLRSFRGDFAITILSPSSYKCSPIKLAKCLVLHSISLQHCAFSLHSHLIYLIEQEYRT